MLRLVAVVAWTLFASVAPLAAQGACPMTYEAFEFAIPHLDLETCPKDLTRDNAFCRASSGNDAVHVFAFAQDGEQCLLRMKSYRAGEYQLTVK
jgi:hypothetical protein